MIMCFNIFIETIIYRKSYAVEVFCGFPAIYIAIIDGDFLQAGYLGSDKMQDKLKTLGVKVTLYHITELIYTTEGVLVWQVLRRVGVSEGILQTCYQFSLTARLAPKWNLVSGWLVQGLLTSTYILLPTVLPSKKRHITSLFHHCFSCPIVPNVRLMLFILTHFIQGWSFCQLEDLMQLVSLVPEDQFPLYIHAIYLPMAGML